MRAEREAEQIVAILQDQLQAIAAREQKFESDNQQLRLEGMEEPERRQLDIERRGWRKRFTEIPAEIEAEPQRIRQAYNIALTRIEPVGLVYLWPDNS